MMESRWGCPINLKLYAVSLGLSCDEKASFSMEYGRMSVVPTYW
jgi:hypothetical protein